MFFKILKFFLYFFLIKVWGPVRKTFGFWTAQTFKICSTFRHSLLIYSLHGYFEKKKVSWDLSSLRSRALKSSHYFYSFISDVKVYSVHMPSQHSICLLEQYQIFLCSGTLKYRFLPGWSGAHAALPKLPIKQIKLLYQKSKF